MGGGSGHVVRYRIRRYILCLNFIESEWGGNLLVAMHRNQNDDARNE
jgi:hypothetical protein